MAALTRSETFVLPLQRATLPTTAFPPGDLHQRVWTYEAPFETMDRSRITCLLPDRVDEIN